MGRTKNLKRSRRDEDEDDGSSDQDVKKSSSKANKKAKKGAAADSGKDDDGNSFWSLGGTRRATISEFKGKTYVNIREYYTDAAGDPKPGKKGIMLTPEQYNKLVEAIPTINSELRDKGHEISDPISNAPASAPAAAAEAPESPASPAKSKSSKSTKSETKKGKKANIEATSDEEGESD